MKPLKTSYNGFTLFEVLVAMTILALASLIFIESQIGSMKLASAIKVRSVASMLAYKKMSELEITTEKEVQSKGIKSISKRDFPSGR